MDYLELDEADVNASHEPQKSGKQISVLVDWLFRLIIGVYAQTTAFPRVFKNPCSHQQLVLIKFSI